MKTIGWAKDKAERLRKDKARNCIGFERCIVAIENGDVLAVIDNPVRKNQRLLILEIESYAYAVPFVETKEEWFFKTVFPSRKYTALYLKKVSTMAREPKIGKFLDVEEKELFEAIEADDYAPGKNHLTAGLKEQLQQSARATINAERTKITLRIAKPDLSKLKAKAMQEGMPYQTLISSILHKAVSE